jgi:hypothetical protein
LAQADIERYHLDRPLGSAIRLFRIAGQMNVKPVRRDSGEAGAAGEDTDLSSGRNRNFDFAGQARARP